MSPNSHIQKMKNQNNNQINKQVDSIGLISCWRKLFVANEWNELSLHRNITPNLTFFVFLFLMTGCELEFWSLEQPVASAVGAPVDSLTTPSSVVFKFVIASFLLL